MIDIIKNTNLEYSINDTFKLPVLSLPGSEFSEGMQLKFVVSKSEQSDPIIEKAFNVNDDLTFTVTLTENEKKLLQIGEYIYKMITYKNNEIDTQISGYFNVIWGASSAKKKALILGNTLMFTVAYRDKIEANTKAIAELLETYVKKEEGKALSANDFTNTYKKWLDDNKYNTVLVVSCKTDEDVARLATDESYKLTKVRFDDETFFLFNTLYDNYVEDEHLTYTESYYQIKFSQNGIFHRTVQDGMVQGQTRFVIGDWLDFNTFSDYYRKKIDSNTKSIEANTKSISELPETYITKEELEANYYDSVIQLYKYKLDKNDAEKTYATKKEIPVKTYYCTIEGNQVTDTNITFDELVNDFTKISNPSDESQLPIIYFIMNEELYGSGFVHAQITNAGSVFSCNVLGTDGEDTNMYTAFLLEDDIWTIISQRLATKEELNKMFKDVPPFIIPLEIVITDQENTAFSVTNINNISYEEAMNAHNSGRLVAFRLTCADNSFSGLNLTVIPTYNHSKSDDWRVGYFKAKEYFDEDGGTLCIWFKTNFGTDSYTDTLETIVYGTYGPTNHACLTYGITDMNNAFENKAPTEKAVIEYTSKYATKEELGSIDIALDSIIAIQNELLGGDVNE